MRISTLEKSLATFGGIALCCGALAQTYPSKPLRWVVGVSAGGATDVTTRLVAQRVSEQVGQPVIVDNRLGAAGNVGAEIVAKSAPDGYTLLTTLATSASNQAVLERVPFDLVRDLTHVTQLTTQSYVLVVHPLVPAAGVKELAALARKAPRPLAYGSSGTGSLQHLAAVLLTSVAGFEAVHVPYKGGAPALVDLIGGRLQFFFGVMLSSMPHIKAGRLNSIAVSSRRRSPIFPDLPTIAESGYPGYVVDNWYGVAVSARTPPAVVERLHAEIARALRTPAVEQRLRADGSEPGGISPAATAETVRDEVQRWQRIVHEAGIKAES
jgi:tripartite-type tricarboxylate transporter receptor subunit TctC